MNARPAFRRSLSLIATACLSGWTLVALGRGGLSGPPGWSPADLEAWAGEQGTVVAAMTLARLGALVLCAYLASLGLLLLLSTVCGLHPLAALTRALTPRLLHASLGIVAGPALLAPAAAASAVIPTDEAPVMVFVHHTGEVDEPVMRWSGATVDDTVAVLDVAATTTATDTVATIATATDTAPVPIRQVAGPAGAAPSDPRAETRTIERGEHFWSIAHETIRERSGVEPTHREVARYWRVLIDANRDRLVDPANPDLVYAGQQIVLPPG